MPKFGETSFKNLKTCDINIVRVCNEVVKTFDCSVLCGSRGASTQILRYRQKKSPFVYPLSNHNPNYDDEGLRRLAHILKCGSSLDEISEKIKTVDDDVLCAIDDSADITYKSRAVDIVPYYPTKPHVRWGYYEELDEAARKVYLSCDDYKEYNEILKNISHWHEFAGRMLGVADSMGIKLGWGGHWKKFPDLPHFELLTQGGNK